MIALIKDGMDFGKRPDRILDFAVLGVSRLGVKKLLGILSGGMKNSGFFGLW